MHRMDPYHDKDMTWVKLHLFNIHCVDMKDDNKWFKGVRIWYHSQEKLFQIYNQDIIQGFLKIIYPYEQYNYTVENASTNLNKLW